MDMNVLLKISAGVTGQQAVDQLKTSMDKLQGATDMAGKAFAFLKNNIGVIGAASSIAGLTSLVTSSIDAAAGMADLSIKTGLSVETLSRFGTVAKLSGTDMEEVATILKKISNNAVDAATGNEKMARLFGALGVKVQDANGGLRKADELLIDLARNLQGVDPEVVTKVMTELGGRGGTNVLPFLKELNERIDTTNAKISTEFANAAKEYQDNMILMGDAASKLGKSLANDLLPSMVRITEEMVKSKQGGGDFLDNLWAGIKQGTREVTVDYQNLGKAIDEQKAKIVSLQETLAALSKDSLAASINRFFSPEDMAIVRFQLTEAQAVLKQLQDMQDKRNAPAPEPATGKTDKILGALGANQDNAALKERLNIMQRLKDEVFGLSQGEDALLLQKARAAGMNGKELAQLQALLTQRAQLKAADRELEEATKEANKQREEALRKQKEMMDAGKRVYDETRTPAEKLNIEIARLNALLAQGAIDWDTYSRAIFKAQDDFEGIKDKGKDAMDELRQAVEGWGRQSADAFVEFAFTGKSSFKDMVNSILKDLARMAIYQMVTKPLFGALGGMLPKFANGGIMTDSGPLELRKYASGGIANSPQLALYGEGRMPEAYVPLPDGRTIPVTMKGAGGGTNNVTVNVNVESGSEQVKTNQGAGELGRAISAAVKQELINQKRPGGLLAA